MDKAFEERDRSMTKGKTFEYGDQVLAGARKRPALVLSADVMGGKPGYSIQYENGERAWCAALLVTEPTPTLFDKPVSARDDDEAYWKNLELGRELGS